MILEPGDIIKVRKMKLDPKFARFVFTDIIHEAKVVEYRNKYYIKVIYDGSQEFIIDEDWVILDNNEIREIKLNRILKMDRE